METEAPVTNQHKQPQQQVPEGSAVSREQEVLLQQQENDASEDEEYLSDSAEIVDSNDITSNIQHDLNLDLKNKEQKIWLVKLPRFLADQWRNKELLNGQELGKIKIKKTTPNDQSTVMKLSLNDNNEALADLPHQYDLQLTRPSVENQYVFSEQNLNNFAKVEVDKTELDFSKRTNTVAGVNGTLDNSRAATPTPVPGAYANNNTNNKNDANANRNNMLLRRRKFNKFRNRDGSEKLLPFVKTIPKKTAILGTIVHECQVIPSMNDPNYGKLLEARKKLLQEKPRASVTLLNQASGVNTLSNAGLTLRTDQSTFLKTSVNTKNKHEGRAIRMPQKDLFDLLFKLFDEYDYWSLKGLKDRTKQPEIYLKETLDQVATLNKKGPYALKYSLKKEYKELKDQERAARLGELANDDDDDEDEDDDKEDDVEMEDVV